MSDKMKILPAPTTIQFLGDGIRTEFQFPFGIFSTNDVEVYIDSERVFSQYTVSGVGKSDGGWVSFAEAPASAAVITIRRNLSIERLTNFQESSELRAAALNKDLDYLTACVQQISADLSRCVALTPTDVGISLTLPSRSARSDKLFGFDAGGNVIVVDPSLVSGPNGWKSLDDIPEGLGSLHYTSQEKSKLETVQPYAAPNPVQVSSAEISAGNETQPRSLSPRDVRDMVQAHALIAPVQKVFGRTGLVVSQTGDYSADQITDTAAKVLMTANERSKLSDIQAGAQVNPPLVSSAEKSAGSETQPRSLSPRDVRDMVQAHAPAAPAISAFFPPIVASADSNNIVTLIVEQSQKSVWVQAFSTQAPVTVRVAAGLPKDFACQIVNDTQFPLNITPYGVGIDVLSPSYTLPIIANRHERVFLTPAPTPNTWSLDGDLVLA